MSDKILERISARLRNMEGLLLDIKHKPVRIHKLFSPQEAATYLNIELSDVYGMMQRNEVTVCKRSRYVYLLGAELDDIKLRNESQN